jgi:hypothetical protein
MPGEHRSLWDSILQKKQFRVVTPFAKRKEECNLLYFVRGLFCCGFYFCVSLIVILSVHKYKFLANEIIVYLFLSFRPRFLFKVWLVFSLC